MRKGSRIGRHSIRFTRRGERLETEIAIDIAIRFGVVTLYSYSHRNHEVWEGDRFLSFASTTDDDGERHVVQARRDGGGILIEADGRQRRASADLVPTTWWRRNSVRTGRWIDTQRGGIVAAKVEEMGRAALDGLPPDVPAEGFRTRRRYRPRHLVCRRSLGRVQIPGTRWLDRRVPPRDTGPLSFDGRPLTDRLSSPRRSTDLGRLAEGCGATDA